MDWRKDSITDRQRKLIEEMQEFSCYPLPLFTGTTKGEASDYIDAHAKLAFEDVYSPAIKDLSAFVNRLKDGHVYGYKDGILYEAKVREPDNTIIRPLPQLRRAET